MKSVPTNELQAAQVTWYRTHGKRGEQRIARDRDGNEYVIGDWSWNRLPYATRETIEPELNKAMEQQFK